MPHQHREMVPALTQRQRGGGQHAESIVEIRPKLLLGGPRLEVPVGGGEDANVGANDLLPAHPLEALVLQHPQDLGLERQRHVSDLLWADQISA
jgi:hypothetical protein